MFDFKILKFSILNIIKEKDSIKIDTDYLILYLYTYN